MTALVAALVFWAQLGHQPATCVQLHPVPLPAHVLGQAQQGGCHVWINRRLLPARTRAQANRLCWTVIHELGHTLGLGHEPSGVMARRYEPGREPGVCWEVSIPATCVVCLIRPLLPPPSGRARLAARGP